MKSFQQFVTEAYDKDLAYQATRKPGEGGRIRSARKKSDGYLAKQQIGQKKKVKAVGGGKTVPAKPYKDRKDIGANKPKSRTQQQPEKERGTAALSPREAQRKAAKERRAAKAGVKTKSADELLSTKKKTVDPNYKPTGKPGNTGTSKKSYSEKERKALYKKGERTLRDIRLKNLGKEKESELKHKETSK